MADITIRKRENIRVYNPNDGSTFVDVPIISEVSVFDQNGQETRVFFDNTHNSNREVHTDTITAMDGSARLDVERIDIWHALDVPDRAQETGIYLDNVTGADSIPPHFSTHFKTHVFKLIGNDPEAWIKTEYIDECHVTDQNGQEYFWILENPDQQADPSDDRRDADSPVRTDLFQNIIDLHWPGTAGPGTGGISITLSFVIGWTRGDNIGGASTEVGVFAGGAGNFSQVLNDWDFSGLDFGPNNLLVLGFFTPSPPDAWNTMSGTGQVAGTHMTDLAVTFHETSTYGTFTLATGGTMLTAKPTSILAGAVLHPVSARMAVNPSTPFQFVGSVHYTD